jgi:hypothetical protein
MLNVQWGIKKNYLLKRRFLEGIFVFTVSCRRGRVRALIGSRLPIYAEINRRDDSRVILP